MNPFKTYLIKRKGLIDMRSDIYTNLLIIAAIAAIFIVVFIVGYGY